MVMDKSNTEKNPCIEINSLDANVVISAENADLTVLQLQSALLFWHLMAAQLI